MIMCPETEGRRGRCGEPFTVSHVLRRSPMRARATTAFLVPLLSASAV